MSIVKFELNETQLALQLRSTLEQADSCYAKEYLPFAQANAKLSDDAFVDTLERQFAAKLLYVAWQGVRWNLDCYRNPINKLRLQTDYEELHGEYLFLRFRRCKPPKTPYVLLSSGLPRSSKHWQFKLRIIIPIWKP
ncbi:MAG: hypothetical protein ACLS4A_13655 [Oscillospiraceae bacterium]